jgi:chromosome segregation ATPase
MRFFVRASFICGAGILMIMIASPVSAQRASVAVFDRTLETLRQSVARLLKENAQINTANLGARARIKVLREDLRSLEAEARHLEEKEAAERQRVQSRNGGVEALKLQVAEADGVLKRTRDEVLAEQAKFNALENEEKILRQKADALGADVALMSRSRANADKEGNSFDALKTEQETLQKKLADVVNRVEEAKRRWQDINAVVTKGPEQLEVLKVENDKLVKAVSQAEADLTRINAQLADVQAAFDKMRADDYGDTRAGRLDSEVKEMTERNRNLESEILTITETREEALKRSQADQEKFGSQYQAKYEELLQHNVDLKFELDSLRKQMVDMDKKKAELEAVVYPAR